jgi:hypothetical protein
MKTITLLLATLALALPAFAGVEASARDAHRTGSCCSAPCCAACPVCCSGVCC